MPINDPVNSVYMNNMYVTGATSQNSNFGTVGGVNNALQTTNATGADNSSNNLGSFTQLLTSMMAMQASNSIGNFADTSGSSSSYMDGMMGLGGSSSLFGTNGSSDSNMMMMLLLLLMASQNNNGQNTNLLGQLTGNTSTGYNTAGTAACPVHGTMGYTSTGAATQGIPSNSWEAATPALTSIPTQRNANTYRAVINQFDVENNARYAVNKQGTGDTYCNIFAWDVTRAMGAEIPHFIDNTTGAPASSGGSYTTELTANQVNDWLNTYGSSYGWVKVSAEEAQISANMGRPAVTSWKNPAGHGHMQVVCPSADGTYNAARGVTISQAGRQLKSYDYIDTVYGQNTLGQVEYFVHV